ncbi:MAG: tetratricopeptide repeat protein, partial [Desulfuromonadaceae bacterium]
TLQDNHSAIRTFLQAMEQDPAFSFAPYNLAVTYLQMGDSEKAMYYFNDALKRFPKLKPQIEPFLKQIR